LRLYLWAKACRTVFKHSVPSRAAYTRKQDSGQEKRKNQDLVCCPAPGRNFKTQWLLEQWHREKGQGNGPGAVQWLCFLSRQKIIGLKQDKIVGKGIEKSQSNRTYYIPA
jgi:hypothetical protein